MRSQYVNITDRRTDRQLAIAVPRSASHCAAINNRSVPMLFNATRCMWCMILNFWMKRCYTLCFIKKNITSIKHTLRLLARYCYGKSSLCLSVCLSRLWSHRLEYFGTNVTNGQTLYTGTVVDVDVMVREYAFYVFLIQKRDFLLFWSGV